MMIDEGKPQDQAAAICYSIFRNKISQSDAEKLVADEAEKKWLPFYEAVTADYDKKKPEKLRKPKKPSVLSGSHELVADGADDHGGDVSGGWGGGSPCVGVADAE
jgi:hypothetical protein